MDKRDHQAQPIGICSRLFNFIFDGPVARGLKRVTSGLAKVPVGYASSMGGNTKPAGGGSVRIPVHGLPKVYMGSTVKVEFVQASRLENSNPTATSASSSHALEKDGATGGGNPTQLQKGVGSPLSPPAVPMEHQGSTWASDPKNKGDKDQAPGIRSLPLLEKGLVQDKRVHIDPKIKGDKDQAPGIGSVPLPHKVDSKNKGDKDQAQGSGSMPLRDKELPPVQHIGVHTGTSLSHIQDKNDSQVNTKQATFQDRGVPPSATVSQATGSKKTTNIKERAEEIEMNKKKEKNMQTGKPILPIEPQKDLKLKGPRLVRPLGREASNINEKSDAFIRQTKEARRKSSGVEPKKS